MKFAYLHNLSIKVFQILLMFFNANIKMETYQQNFPHNKSFNGVWDTEK